MLVERRPARFEIRLTDEEFAALRAATLEDCTLADLVRWRVFIAHPPARPAPRVRGIKAARRRAREGAGRPAAE